jgi:hypothetical protein
MLNFKFSKSTCKTKCCFGGVIFCYYWQASDLVQSPPFLCDRHAFMNVGMLMVPTKLCPFGEGVQWIADLCACVPVIIFNVISLIPQ